MLRIEKEFVSRGIVTLIIGVILAVFILFKQMIWMQMLIVLCGAFLAAIGVKEYANLAMRKNIAVKQQQMMIATAVATILLYMGLTYPAYGPYAFSCTVLVMVYLFISRFQDSTNALMLIAIEGFGICYLAFPMSMLLAILYTPSAANGSVFWLMYLILVTKMSDIGGYLAGKLLGKSPLALHISPKKTLAGAAGGFIFSIITSLCFAACGKEMGFSYLHAACLGAFVSILAQIGDLSESLLKRDAKAKDSNKIPGIGGILDLLDSLLFTAPIVYFYTQL